MGHFGSEGRSLETFVFSYVEIKQLDKINICLILVTGMQSSHLVPGEIQHCASKLKGPANQTGIGMSGVYSLTPKARASRGLDQDINLY